jgi:hypothetical protein
MDREYAGSKFILTVRDKEDWTNKWAKLFPQFNVDQKLLSKYKRELNRVIKNSGGIINFLTKSKYFKSLIDIPHRVHRTEFQHIAAYGLITLNNRDRMAYVYDLHIKNVIEYFKDRPEDLLILNIFEGDGWDKLCDFLSIPVPDVPFPHIK